VWRRWDVGFFPSYDYSCKWPIKGEQEHAGLRHILPTVGRVADACVGMQVIGRVVVRWPRPFCVNLVGLLRKCTIECFRQTAMTGRIGRSATCSRHATSVLCAYMSLSPWRAAFSAESAT
jgi:hypothetical protein